jgi:hypothetical protein
MESQLSSYDSDTMPHQLRMVQRNRVREMDARKVAKTACQMLY